MKNIKKIKSGDIVYLKSGAFGVISKIFYNVFGDNENAYEISFLNNKTSINRSKDFVFYL